MTGVGNRLVCAGGLLLAALMVYVLASDAPGLPAWPSWGNSAHVDEVAVFFPNRADWEDFRAGIRACTGRRLARGVEDTGDVVVVETPGRKRRIRFAFQDVRGVQRTGEAVLALAAGPSPPIAVVGSSNTVLTVALAEALREASDRRARDAPVLLIPWASSVQVAPPDPAEGPVPLLSIDPGRTFRFCPNNQAQADLAVGALLALDPGSAPARAFVLEDRHDAYSADLAESFRRSINRMAPEAVVVQDRSTLTFTGISPAFASPSPAELERADRIWERAISSPSKGATWVVLPVQAEPARRMIASLRARAPQGLGPGDGPLRVVVGDGLGLESLSELDSTVPFPVWCVSSASLPDPKRPAGAEPPPGAQIPAEIVSALVRLLDSDRVRDAADLRDALDTLKIPAGDPGAMGRALQFGRTGEREGAGLGHVMFIRSGEAGVFATAKRPDGGWDTAVAVGEAQMPGPIAP